MEIADRIQLCEAMGWQWVGGSDAPSKGVDNCWREPGIFNGRHWFNYYSDKCPDPFTDANDDYAVLEWMRSLEGNEKHNFHAPSPMFSTIPWDYKIGDYARACLKVINNENA